MTKRKLDDNTLNVSKRKKLDNNCRISDVSKEFYSNQNIKSLLLHNIKDKIIDVDILNYDVNYQKEKQRDKQQQKLIKKLSFDLDKFKSSQLTEKFYILAQRDNNNIITTSSVIRFFTHDNNTKTIHVIPVLHKYLSLSYKDLDNNIEPDILDTLCFKRSGILIKCEGISISNFIEVIKLIINNVNNLNNINESIKNILEESSDSYKNIHQEIIDKYKTQCQNNEEEDDYSVTEDAVLDVIDEIKDIIENEEIIRAVVEQLIVKVVKKSERGEKILSWDTSTVDNEVRLNDDEAIKIFAKAVECWDAKLFKEAKDKSIDFAGLVVSFWDEIKHKFFWEHFSKDTDYKRSIDNKLNTQNIVELLKEYNSFFAKTMEGYIFLINNAKNFPDQLKTLIFTDQLGDHTKSSNLIGSLNLQINQVILIQDYIHNDDQNERNNNPFIDNNGSHLIGAIDNL